MTNEHDPLLLSVICAHGSLARKCEICERDQRIAELEAEVARWEQMFDDANEQRQSLLREKYADPRHADLWERIKALEAEQAKLVRALRVLMKLVRNGHPFRVVKDDGGFSTVYAVYGNSGFIGISNDQYQAVVDANALGAVAHHFAPKEDDDAE